MLSHLLAVAVIQSLHAVPREDDVDYTWASCGLVRHSFYPAALLILTVVLLQCLRVFEMSDIIIIKARRLCGERGHSTSDRSAEMKI